jgi:hypothetical protein
MQTFDLNFIMSAISSLCTIAAAAIVLSWPQGAAKWILGAVLLADLFLAAIWQAITVVSALGIFEMTSEIWQIASYGTAILRLVPQILMIVFAVRCGAELREEKSQLSRNTPHAATPSDYPQ